MSNIITAINFLKEKPDDRFLSIVNQANNQQVGTKAIYLRDIPQEDLKNYIKFNLGEVTETVRVWIEVREKQGVTSVKKNSFAVEVHPEYRQMQAQTQTHAVAPVQQPVQMPVHNAMPMMDFLGNPGMLGSMIEPHIKAARLADREIDLANAKDEIRELKKKNDILEIDLRTALTKISTAEAQKEMAVMLAEAKNKGFMDSDGFQKLLEKAPDMFEKIMAAKNGAMEPVEQLGNPDWSETKKEFLTVLDYLSDENVQMLGAICFKMNDPIFANQMKQLINPTNA
jgi:hypothetical protein